MNKILPVLAVVCLLALGIAVRGAAAGSPAIAGAPFADGDGAFDQNIDTRADGMRIKNTAGITLADEFGLHRPSLVAAAHAAPVTTDTQENHGPPTAIGAWFIGFGLLAFVISRRRFKK